jgi:hypothetical protein
MHPPRSGAFSASLAAPCALAGIWMNSKGIVIQGSCFKKSLQGCAPAPRSLFVSFVFSS